MWPAIDWTAAAADLAVNRMDANEEALSSRRRSPFPAPGGCEVRRPTPSLGSRPRSGKPCLRILYHHRTLRGDAQGVHIAEMIAAFRACGHEVQEFSLVGGDEPTADRGTRSWTAVSRLLRGPLYEIAEGHYDRAAARALSREVRRFHPDLDYERYALAMTAGARAARRAGVPVFIEVNAPLAKEKSEWGGLAFPRRALRGEVRALSMADRVLAVSTPLKRVLVEEGVPEERITVLPNGVDADRFRPDRDGAAVRRRLGIHGAPVIGFAGWFRPWHGLRWAVSALASPHVPEEAVLLLVGDGPEREGLEKLAARLSVRGRLFITGATAHEQIPDYVAAFDVAVQPRATPYASPMKLLEYLAAGRCVLAPDQENVRELVEPGTDAALFPPGDEVAFARRLGELLRDPGRRSIMGIAARRLILEKGRLWTSNAERVEKLVGAPIGSRGSAP